MRVVHSLEGNAGVIAVEVAVLYKVFDGIDDLRRLDLVQIQAQIDIPS